MVFDYTGEVLEVISRTPDVKSFRIARPEGSSYKPGQWLFVHLEINGREEKKPLSFSSSPTETGHIEFTKRITSSDFSKRLDSVIPGDTIKVKMPYGTFTFEGEFEKIALLSGGIGITPFKSICKYAGDKELDTDIRLLYGNRTPGDIIFRDDLDIMMAANPRLRVVHTMTSGDAAEKGWNGNVGRISAEMVRREIPDFADRVFFLCGPPGMVECLVTMLKSELNISPSRIIRENFVGY